MIGYSLVKSATTTKMAVSRRSKARTVHFEKCPLTLLDKVVWEPTGPFSINCNAVIMLNNKAVMANEHKDFCGASYIVVMVNLMRTELRTEGHKHLYRECYDLGPRSRFTGLGSRTNSVSLPLCFSPSPSGDKGFCLCYGHIGNYGDKALYWGQFCEAFLWREPIPVTDRGPFLQAYICAKIQQESCQKPLV